MRSATNRERILGSKKFLHGPQRDQDAKRLWRTKKKLDRRFRIPEIPKNHGLETKNCLAIAFMTNLKKRLAGLILPVAMNTDSKGEAKTKNGNLEDVITDGFFHLCTSWPTLLTMTMKITGCF